MSPIVLCLIVFAASFASHGFFILTVHRLSAFAISRGWKRLGVSSLQSCCVGLACLIGAFLAHRIAPEVIEGGRFLALLFFCLLLNEVAASLFVGLWLPGILAVIRCNAARQWTGHFGQTATQQAAGAFADIQADPSAKNQAITIGGKSFDCAEILLISAENDYVSVISKAGKHLIRGKLSDAAMQIPRCFGQQVHRSFWLSRDIIEKIERVSNRSVVIVTKQHGRVPVARARCRAVLIWLADLGYDDAMPSRPSALLAAAH
ncbi:MAG: LytTR family DNA-binding domain-containing protein [Rhodobacteraceae bacterium]|nr:LytTR family DNA-binding domain-containing protein [Paracoccaceae bacterium]